MVVPDPLSPRAPPTPSWSRSEDVRNSLYVLDQVLSEFDDDLDPDDDTFLEDQYFTSNDRILKKDDEANVRKIANSSKVTERNGKNGKHSPDVESEIKLKSRKQSREIDKSDDTSNDHGSVPPPLVDRSKKPKHAPPALPKKVAPEQRLNQHQNTNDKADIHIDHDRHSSNGTSTSSVGSSTIKDVCPTRSGSDSGTVKSTASAKSQESLGTTSSGTHDYQEINSDLCEAIHSSYEKRLEEQKLQQKQEKQQQQQLQQHHQQQQHALFLKHQQHQKRLLQENLINAHRIRGRSHDPKRRSAGAGDGGGGGGPRQSRSTARGRSSGPTDRRDRSGGRRFNVDRRSRSSERMLESRYSRNFSREQIAENLLMNQNFVDATDPRNMDPLMHDPRFMVDPRLVDPSLSCDPRLIDPAMFDPMLLDPRYDHLDAMGYPIHDAVQFPHLMNYREHLRSSSIGPILPPGDFGPGYPMYYPYDVPFQPDPNGLTPEEIEHLQSGGDPSLISTSYLDYSRHPYPASMPYQMNYPMEYPVDYPMDFASLDYPIPQEFLPYPPLLEGIVDVVPGHRRMRGSEDFLPPTPVEAKRTIDRIVRGPRHSLADLRSSASASPAQLARELRRTSRGYPPHPSSSSQHHQRRPSGFVDSSEVSSSNYDAVVGDAGGFRVGDVVRGSPARRSDGAAVAAAAAAANKGGSAVSMPHFSPAKDSGFEEVAVGEEPPSSGSSPSATGTSAAARTIGKTKGGMVVSGVLSNVSNMYIPAPPSPTPDYDEEGALSDGAESDILKGSQFYVVEGDGEDGGADGGRKKMRKPIMMMMKGGRKDPKKEEQKKAEKFASSGSLVTDVEDKSTDDKNFASNVSKVDDGSNRNSMVSNESKRGSISEDSLKEGGNNSVFSAEDLEENRGSNTCKSQRDVGEAVSSICSPLEKMMTQFHESLPPLNSLDETHFSDDSLEDSVTEDASTIATSRHESISRKQHWSDSISSVCSANDSTASFDYVRAGDKPLFRNYNSKKMARSKSQSESANRLSSLAESSHKGYDNFSQFDEANRKSVSNTNLSNSQLRDKSSNNEDFSSRANRRQQTPTRGNANISQQPGDASTTSSDSAKFDTIKNMLKEGLIPGLDEEPPDFMPPPPFLHFNNGPPINLEKKNPGIDGEFVTSNSRRRCYSQSERNNIDRSSPSSDKTETTLTRSNTNSTPKHADHRDYNRDRKNFSNRVQPVSRNDSKGKESSKLEYERNRDECDVVEIYAENKYDESSQSFEDDVPPPLPPPRDSSLPLSNNHQQASSRNSSWLHGPRLPSLKSKKTFSSNSNGKPSNEFIRGSTNSLVTEPDAEMTEVSIYARSARDGDKVTHVDDFGNEIKFPHDKNQGEYDNKLPFQSYIEETALPIESKDLKILEHVKEVRSISSTGQDKIENIKNLEAHRRTPEGQLAISDSEDRNGFSAKRSSLDNSCITKSNCNRISKSGSNTESHHKHSKSESNFTRSSNGAASSPSITPEPSKAEIQNIIPRTSSPSKKRQSRPPPIPPANTDKFRSVEDLSSRRNETAVNNGKKHQSNGRNHYSVGAQLSSNAGTLPSVGTSDSNAEYHLSQQQDLRRATSLVVASGKKGAAPPVPKTRTVLPERETNVQSSPEPPAVGYMPSEHVADSKFRFNIFKGFRRRNKYSFDKA